MIEVAIEEEYGYRHWIWVHPGTEAEVLSDWQSKRAPLNFFNPSKGRFQGEMIQVETEEQWTRWMALSEGAFAHVHMPDDSYLRIHGVSYPSPFAEEDGAR